MSQSKEFWIFFCLGQFFDIDKTISEANRLICEYNKRTDCKKLVLCDRGNLGAWLSIPKRMKQEIKGTALEKIYHDKFVDKASYIKASRQSCISETTYYTKSKALYEIAINYLYYERLIIVDEQASSARHG